MNIDPSQTASQSDVLDVARAQAMQHALGHDPSIQSGDPLPPFFHQLYFWQPQPASSLGRDGHPKVGGLVPDMGLPRRMWAGGSLMFDRPLVVSSQATRISRCESATRKQGRTGPLAFVTMRHEVWQNDALCLTEWQDLVYRKILIWTRHVQRLQWPIRTRRSAWKWPLMPPCCFAIPR